ncbi:vitamin B12 ABC transporter ATP-binding protein BtuD [Pantoea sp. FN060301]|uniref:vitamin B12 ABC transporter ATP-binding protein BtuD n=1 Tax=Pantoea sp. FN060301 TaxID=3420380 RepID=UPI003D16B3CD
MLLACREVAVSQRFSPFSAEVRQGELIHLLGPNGAGKSSLLAALSGLLPASGDILFAGKRLEAWPANSLARRRAYLHQQQLPAGRMPVWHYLDLHRLPRTQDDEQRLLALSQTFQLEEKLDRPLTQLSGGEWQRVRLAAMFCQIARPEGKLLLLDEPLSGLDLAQQAAFDAHLASLIAEGLTAIVSGHDINHTLHHAQRVWLMKKGEMVSQGSVKEVLQPVTLSAVYQVPFRRLAVDGYEMLSTHS